MEKDYFRLIINSLFIFFFVGVFGFIFYAHFPVAGLVISLPRNKISQLSPQSRVMQHLLLGSQIQRQVDDMAYFTTQSQGFDQAVITFKYINPDPQQEIFVGFRDEAQWHYQFEPLNLPFINQLDWKKTSSSKPFLYSKSDERNVEQLLSSYETNKIVGFYHLDPDSQAKFEVNSLPNYQPSDKMTEITTDLRGSHTLYAFVQNEQFYFRVTKENFDENVPGAPLTVRVYKNGKQLTEKTAGDGGVAEISYAGGFPENGVYRIEINTSEDTLITSIQTNLSKLVFEKKVFPVTKNTKLYTDARDLSFETYHDESLQDIKVDDQTVSLNTIRQKEKLHTDDLYSHVEITQGDTLIEGTGYFSFTKDQYFTPFAFRHYSVTNTQDLELIDYLMTDYEAQSIDGSWRETTIQFDLKDAYYQQGKLSWIIRAPGLRSYMRELYIMDIEVILKKDPLIKL